MVKNISPLHEIEMSINEKEDLQKRSERIIQKHKAMFEKLASSECEDMQKISDDEKMQKVYEHLVEKHKKMLKKLAE